MPAWARWPDGWMAGWQLICGLINSISHNWPTLFVRPAHQGIFKSALSNSWKVILFHYLSLPTEFPTFVKTGYLFEFMEKKMCTITSKYLQISAQRKVVFCWSPHQPKCQTVRSPFIFLQQYFLNLIKVFVKSDQKYFSIWSTGCAHMLGNHSPDQLICPQGAASDCSRVTHADQPLRLFHNTSCI